MGATSTNAGDAGMVAMNRTSRLTTNSTKVTTKSISPDASRSPRLAGGRSSATPSPVTRSSVVIVANSAIEVAAGCVDIAAQRTARRTLAPVPRIDLDAYVVAHAHEWARLEQLLRARAVERSAE